MKMNALPGGVGKEVEKSEMVELGLMKIQKKMMNKNKSFELFMEMRAFDSNRKGTFSLLLLFLLFILILFVI